MKNKTHMGNAVNFMLFSNITRQGHIKAPLEREGHLKNVREVVTQALLVIRRTIIS